MPDTPKNKLLSLLILFICICLYWSCNSNNTTQQNNSTKDQKSSFEEWNIVDLTHTLDSLFPFIPTSVTYGFQLKAIATIDGFGVAANEWKIHEHIGTQIDAPNHFVKEGMSADKLDVRDLFVPAVVIDISEKAANNPDAILTVQDIEAWEKKNGSIPAHAAVFMYSGWDAKIHTPQFIGLDSNHKKHFPGISRDAAQFLIEKRSIAGAGVDVVSIDPGIDDTYQTHRVILENKKWVLECINNLKQIPTVGAYVFVGAPKIKGATGGLTRVIAIWK
jgi:kynurenine formamidase